MEIIDELEEVKRGLYGGATGYIDIPVDADGSEVDVILTDKDEKIIHMIENGICPTIKMRQIRGGL